MKSFSVHFSATEPGRQRRVGFGNRVVRRITPSCPYRLVVATKFKIFTFWIQLFVCISRYCVWFDLILDKKPLASQSHNLTALTWLAGFCTVDANEFKSSRRVPSVRSSRETSSDLRPSPVIRFDPSLAQTDSTGETCLMESEFFSDEVVCTTEVEEEEEEGEGYDDDDDEDYTEKTRKYEGRKDVGGSSKVGKKKINKVLQKNVAAPAVKSKRGLKELKWKSIIVLKLLLYYCGYDLMLFSGVVNVQVTNAG